MQKRAWLFLLDISISYWRKMSPKYVLRISLSLHVFWDAVYDLEANIFSFFVTIQPQHKNIIAFCFLE